MFAIRSSEASYGQYALMIRIIEAAKEEFVAIEKKEYSDGSDDEALVDTVPNSPDYPEQNDNGSTPPDMDDESAIKGECWPLQHFIPTRATFVPPHYVKSQHSYLNSCKIACWDKYAL